MANSRLREDALKVLAVLALIGALAAAKMAQDVDHDMFFQLKRGERVMREGHFPIVEDYSFTEGGHAMVATEWLAETVSYLVHRAGGFAGLIGFNVALFLATFYLAFLIARRRLSVLESLALTSLLGFAFANFYAARPQNWTFLFVAYYLHASLRWEEGDLRAPWLMAAVAPFWSNMHGGFMLGLALMSATGARLALRQRRCAPLFPVVLAAALCCLHPNGIHAVTYPLWFMASPPPGRALIGEWRPVDFSEITTAPYLLVFALLFRLAYAGSLGPRPWALLTAVLAVMALRGRKLLPEFCLAAVVPMSAGFATAGSRTARNWLLPAGLGSLLCLASVVAFNRRSAGLDMERYFPREAVSLIAARHPDARIFNSYDWGGYLIWKLYPRARVFIDGRLEPYWDLLPGDYATIMRAGPGWRRLLDDYGVTAVLIRPGERLAEGLSHDAGWRVEHADGRSVLFAR